MVKAKARLSRTCQFCGKLFSANRSDTRFCCDNHRVAYSRWATKLTAHHIRVERQIEFIADYLGFPDANRAARDTLTSIIGVIRNKLDHLDEKE